MRNGAGNGGALMLSLVYVAGASSQQLTERPSAKGI